jgi:hypothetical protein
MEIMNQDHAHLLVILVALLCFPGQATAQAPTIASLPPVTPEAGAVDVQDGTAEIRVRFSKKMMAASWSVVKVDDDSFPKIIGKPCFEADGKTFVLPIQLQSKRTYVCFGSTPRASRVLKDASGRSDVPYLLMFKVK